MSSRLSRRVTVPSLIGVVALVLSACTGGFDSATSTSSTGTSQSITIALNGEPSTLNPIFDISVPALSVFRSVFSGLTAIDDEGDVQPSLATSWESDETAETWVFTLNEDATFHDGTPVTADDVVFTFEQGMTDPEAATASYVSRIDSVEATGEYEVTFHLNTPYAPFDRQVTLIPVVSQAAYEADPEGYAEAPVGSGPYKVVSWTRGDTLTLERYDDYFGDAAAIEDVEYRFVDDETTRGNSLQSGDVDVAQISASNVETLQSTDGIEVVEQESNRVLYLGFNSSTGPLADTTVRQAIDMAIDRDAIVETIYQGLASPSGQLVAPTTFGYDEDIEPTAYDPDAARELLAASDYDGEAIVLSYPATELPQITQLAQAIAGYLEDIGLTVELDQQETANFRSAWLATEFSGIYIWQFAPSIMDADLPLSLLVGPDSTRYFTDDEVDALMAEQIGITDTEERAAVLGELLQLVHDEVYYSALFTDVYAYGVSEGTSWSPRADGLFALD
ncbi:MAG TPA: ABC transporter substrate-binding protein [Cellulomonas sp.]